MKPRRILGVLGIATILWACSSSSSTAEDGLDGRLAPTAPERILLSGTILGPNGPIEGQVLVEDEKITCVEAGTACGSSRGAEGAKVVDADGVIAPGLIDTHNHILFDIFDDDDWLPARLYSNHDEWTNEARYQAMLDVKQCLANDSQGKPAWCAQTPYGTPAGSLRCEMDKWGEVKGLIAGTTSIVGLPGQSAACFGSLARSVDVAQNGLGGDKIQTSAIFPPANPNGTCTHFASQKTSAFLVHAGEGIDARSLAEFGKLGTMTNPASCLYASQTVITHGTAFTPTEFATMAAAGMKLTWSPQSNVSLYGKTTDIPAALDAGVLVALAPDWSMGGSQNLLDEMRFAKSWSDAHWAGRLTTKDIVAMATVNAAKVLGLAGTLGELKVGATADLAVYAGNRHTPYDTVVGAHPKNVRLVMVGGKVLYGDKTFESAAPPNPGCETIDICGASKFLCAATASNVDKLDQTFATFKSNLETALTAVDALTPTDGWNFAPLPPVVSCH